MRPLSKRVSTPTGRPAHALAPVAELPVQEVISAARIVADLTLGLGNVVHDYLR